MAMIRQRNPWGMLNSPSQWRFPAPNIAYNAMTRFLPRGQRSSQRMCRYPSYDDCYDCDMTGGRHICASCLSAEYHVEPDCHSCACSFCDFCDDGDYYQGGGYGSCYPYDARIGYQPRNRFMNGFSRFMGGIGIPLSGYGGGRGGIHNRRRFLGYSGSYGST